MFLFSVAARHDGHYPFRALKQTEIVRIGIMCHPSIGAQDKPLYALNRYGNAQSGMVTDIDIAISGLISLFGNV